ncbi:MAG TPA: NAD(P)-dependent oxidoreductase [Stenomitos sp.]
MAGRRILITGASGCIGHYLSEAFIQHSDDDLFLLVRDRAKLQVEMGDRPGVSIIEGDMQDLDPLRPLLATMHCAILVATGWGDFNIDVTQTLALLQALDPQICQQVVYFSTASILGRDRSVLPEAKTLGTPYVQAKALCYEKLQDLDLGFPVVTVFPTLVVGGDPRKPYSHLSSGLPEVLKWTGLLRFLKADGSFHFIHAQDIATVVLQLVQHPELAPSQQLVLGNAPITVNSAIATLCQFTHRRIYTQFDLKPWLINLLIRAFNIQMAAWDHFCINYRHFQYENPVSPKTFGIPCYCSTLRQVLQLSSPDHTPPQASREML